MVAEVTVNAVGGKLPLPPTPYEVNAQYHLEGALQVGNPEAATARAMIGIGYGLLAVVAELRAARS